MLRIVLEFFLYAVPICFSLTESKIFLCQLLFDIVRFQINQLRYLLLLESHKNELQKNKNNVFHLTKVLPCKINGPAEGPIKYDDTNKKWYLRAWQGERCTVCCGGGGRTPITNNIRRSPLNNNNSVASCTTGRHL